MRHSLTTAKSNEEVLSIYDDGKVVWHPDAEARLNDDAEWVGEKIIFRMIIRALWEKRGTPSEELTREIMAQLKWYRDEAEAISKNLKDTRTGSVMASVQVLGLDGGGRADRAFIMFLKEQSH